MSPIVVVFLKFLLYIFALLVVLLFLFLLLPMWVVINYDEKNLVVKVRILGIPVRIYPESKLLSKFLSKSSRNKPKKEKSSEEIKDTGKEGEKAIKETQMSFEKTMSLLSLAKETMVNVTQELTVKNVKLSCVIHGEDAAQTALNYGKANAAFANAYSMAEVMFKKITVQEVEFVPDFTNEFEQNVRFACQIGAKPVSVLKLVLFLFKQLKKMKIL